MKDKKRNFRQLEIMQYLNTHGGSAKLVDVQKALNVYPQLLQSVTDFMIVKGMIVKESRGIITIPKQ